MSIPVFKHHKIYNDCCISKQVVDAKVIMVYLEGTLKRATKTMSLIEEAIIEIREFEKGSWGATTSIQTGEHSSVCLFPFSSYNFVYKSKQRVHAKAAIGYLQYALKKKISRMQMRISQMLRQERARGTFSQIRGPEMNGESTATTRRKVAKPKVGTQIQTGDHSRVRVRVSVCSRNYL
jgi:hypothetical protein